MQIGILGLGLGGKDRRVKKGKPPEMCIGSSQSESAGGPPKCELHSVIGAGTLTGMLMSPCNERRLNVCLSAVLS